MADDRFKALQTDPRYRLPSRKQAQTAVDPRFKRLFTDDGFRKKATIDRYGRKIKHDTANRKDLDRRFRLEERTEKSAKSQVASASSDDEELSHDESVEEEDVLARDPAREGFSGSSSSEEESTSDEEEDEAEGQLADETAGNEQIEEIATGEVSKRIAVVNLDWDHVRAIDIMAVAQSFAPSGGRVVDTIIYPSEFGRERMEREELEGPPREIFASSVHRDYGDVGNDSSESDEDERIKKRLISEQAADGQEFDTAKLRQYQLERLRYYYAVVTCDSENTAKTIYDNMDGREYLTTANFFDLRFVPEGTTFDDDPKDACVKLPDGYKPNDFKTEALTHSKVRLTWDDDDTTRKEVQKRAFSRAEMDQEDLRAYIGSDSSDADSVTSRKSAAESSKQAKRDAAKAKMRAALGLPDEPVKAKRRKDEAVGDMQITFSAGLSSFSSSKKPGKGVFENEPQDEESTRDRYVRKERERRQKRKDKMKSQKGEVEEAESVRDQDDKGFDDPFFNDPAAAAQEEKRARKAEKEKKRAAKDAEKADAASRRAELELLMAEDDGNEVKHFDMKEIEKAEKLSKKKKSKGKHATTEIARDDFEVETADPRFKQLFESHEYAIDPTNPKFKNTQSMKALLEEGRKKRKTFDDDYGEQPPKRAKAANGSQAKDAELDGLVARLKTNSKGK